MHEQQGPTSQTGGPAEGEAHDLKAELAKLALEAPPEPRHLGWRLRNYFLTGLVVVGPVTITLYIAWYFINIIDAWVKPYIPRFYNPDTYVPFPIPGVGLIFAIIGLTLIGALAANLLGRSLISAGEMMLGRTPIVRNVYRGLKQIFELVVTASAPGQEFQKVGLIEFPSKGIWSIVFVTGEATARDFRRDRRRRPHQRVHADRHAAAHRLRVLRAAQDRGAGAHDGGGRRQDHHLGRHDQPRDAGAAARPGGEAERGAARLAVCAAEALPSGTNLALEFRPPWNTASVIVSRRYAPRAAPPALSPASSRPESV